MNSNICFNGGICLLLKCFTLRYLKSIRSNTISFTIEDKQTHLSIKLPLNYLMLFAITSYIYNYEIINILR